MTFYKTDTHLNLEISLAEAGSINIKERHIFNKLIMQEIVTFGFDIERDIITYFLDQKMCYVISQTICEITDPPNLLLLAAPKS